MYWIKKNIIYNCEIFFYSLLFRDVSTSLVISRLGSLGVSLYQKAAYFYCCVVNVSIVKFTELILWYMTLMNNGQMDRGNENPTQHLPWWLRKTTKKTSIRLVGTGIWTRVLPNASLLRYHGTTSLGNCEILLEKEITVLIAFIFTVFRTGNFY